MATTKTRKAHKRLKEGTRYIESKGLFERRFSVNGVRYSVYARTQKECDDKESEKRQSIKEGRAKVKGDTQTFEHYAAKWLEGLDGTVSSSTIFTYSGKIKTICQTMVCDGTKSFGSLKLKEITPEIAKELQTALHKTLSLSCDNTNQIISRAKCIMGDAEESEIIAKNPFSKVHRLRRTEEKITTTVHRALTKEETQALLDAAKSVNEYYHNLIRFFLNTGLRCGECGALRYSDVDLKNNILHVRRTVTRAETGEFMIGSTVKTETGARDIPLNDETIASIRWQMDYNKTLNAGKITRLDDLLFVSLDGFMLNPNTINDALEKICKVAGIDRLTVHGLRDCFATRCAESGMAPKTLMELMGHTDIRVTMGVYVHVMNQAKVTALKAVNFY